MKLNDLFLLPEGGEKERPGKEKAMRHPLILSLSLLTIFACLLFFYLIAMTNRVASEGTGQAITENFTIWP